MSIKVFEDWPRPCAVSHLAGMLQKYAQADMHALKLLATLKHWLRFMSSLTYVYISLMDIIISKCITWRNLIYFFSLVQLAWKSARQVSVPMPGSRDVSALFEHTKVWEISWDCPVVRVLLSSVNIDEKFWVHLKCHNQGLLELHFLGFIIFFPDSKAVFSYNQFSW